MKKQMPKLTLNRETLRKLDTKELGNALGGAINVKSLAGECTLDTAWCSGSPMC
jgi:hypothetical protein